MNSNILFEQQKAKSCAISCSIFYFLFVPIILYFLTRSIMLHHDPKMAALSHLWLPINLTFWGITLISIFASLTLMWGTYLKGYYRQSRETFWAVPMVTFGILLILFYAIPVLIFSFTDLVEILLGP